MKVQKKSKLESKKYFQCACMLTILAIFLVLVIFGCHFNGKQEPLEGGKKTMREYLRSSYAENMNDQPGIAKIGMSLFKEKCSTCHDLDKAMTVIKDQEVWVQTIKRMQYHSKGTITDIEAKKIVDFHVSRQQLEIDNFKETCTKCHDDKRINNRSMSEEQWLDTIRRMQQKAPDLISDEKVALLAAYFHRRELVMARIFYDKCPLCHLNNSGKTLSSGFDAQMNGLIVLANEEFGRSLQVKDSRSILTSHVEREKRNSQFYENDCNKCHADEWLKKESADMENSGERTRSDWIFFIATLQGVGFSKEIQNNINYQIDFHISRHKTPDK